MRAPNVGEKLEGSFLTFIELTDRIKDGRGTRQRGLFKCECGKTTNISLSKFFSKNTKSCGCLLLRSGKKSPINKDYSGTIVNGIRVLEKIYDRRINNQLIYKLECPFCKNIFEHHLPSLRKKHVQSCGCLIHQIGKSNKDFTGYEEIYGVQFNSYRNDALKRGLEFNVAIEYVWEIFIKQDRKCALTGQPLAFRSMSTKSDGNASLDRIDSSKGYLEGNVQWVDKVINKLKRNYHEDEFIRMCRLVALHNPPPSEI